METVFTWFIAIVSISVWMAIYGPKLVYLVNKWRGKYKFDPVLTNDGRGYYPIEAIRKKEIPMLSVPISPKLAILITNSANTMLVSTFRGVNSLVNSVTDKFSDAPIADADEVTIMAMLDAMRALNIGAALFKTPIPVKYLYIDERSKEILNWFEYEMALMSPMHSFDKRKMLEENFEPVILPKSSPHTFNLIGAFYLAEQNIPHVEIFCIRFVAKYPKYRLNLSQIKSYVTAFAIMSGMRIPMCYVKYDALTHQLLQKEEEPKKSHLSVVK